MQDQPPDLEWRDGHVPASRRFNDPYFSVDDGLAETGHVFLAGNGLPGRFTAGFRIAELGFGTGLNCLVTLAAWRAAGSPAPVSFTSFEAFPMDPADMATALAAFAPLVPLIPGFMAAFQLDTNPGNGRENGQTGSCLIDPGFTLTIIRGDARETLPQWGGQADAWFLDGFSPARNPEMWEPGLMAEVARHTAPGGTITSYTAAGHVRRALAEAGLEVARVPGYGRKRHMTTARKPL